MNKVTLIAVAGLAACTKEDTDFAKHKLEKAKEEIKQARHSTTGCQKHRNGSRTGRNQHTSVRQWSWRNKRRA